MQANYRGNMTPFYKGEKEILLLHSPWPINEMMKTAFKLMFWLSVLRDPVVVAFGIRISRTKKMKVNFLKCSCLFMFMQLDFNQCMGMKTQDVM